MILKPAGFISKSQQQDLDTLTVINLEKTQELQQMDKYKRFEEWLQLHGARHPFVEYPVCFGQRGELIGLAAKEDMPQQKAFLFVP